MKGNYFGKSDLGRIFR